VTVVSFSSAKKLLADMEREQFDAIFLDILMPELNGFDASKMIRESDSLVPIIFCTSSPDYAVAGYTVQAFDYLLKPYTVQQLQTIIDKLFKPDTMARKKLSLVINKKLVNIPYDNITFAESEGRYVYIHTMNETESIKYFGKLSDIEEQLHNNRFLRTHQSYLVNMDYVKEASNLSFTLQNGYKVAIRAKQWPQIVQAYHTYMDERTFSQKKK
jgi:DNA-binding LytR/AlgR family response regulator